MSVSIKDREKADEAPPGSNLSIYEQVHLQSVHTPFSTMVSELSEVLTSRLVAYIAGVKDVRTVNRWANGTVGDARPAIGRRLRAAYEIVTLLQRFESPTTIRAWFIGMDPILESASPADALHHGLLKETLGAARHFIAYG